jgi:hypothetical protein
MFKISFTGETFNKLCLRFRVREVKYRIEYFIKPQQNI